MFHVLFTTIKVVCSIIFFKFTFNLHLCISCQFLIPSFGHTHSHPLICLLLPVKRKYGFPFADSLMTKADASTSWRQSLFLAFSLSERKSMLTAINYIDKAILPETSCYHYLIKVLICIQGGYLALVKLLILFCSARMIWEMLMMNQQQYCSMIHVSSFMTVGDVSKEWHFIWLTVFSW